MVNLLIPTPGGPNSGAVGPPPVTFLRGDADEDGDVDADDLDAWLAVVHLDSGALAACEDRFDANDDGEIDIADADFLAVALAPGGPAIPQPFPFAGLDPTADNIPCGTPVVSPPFPPSPGGTLPGGAVFELALGTASAQIGGQALLPVTIDSPVAFGGFAFGITTRTGELAIDAIEPGTATTAAAQGAPEFFGVDRSPFGDAGATVGCLLRLVPPFALIPAGSGLEIAVVHGTVLASAVPGISIPVEFSDFLGDPAIPTRITVDGVSYIPVASAGEVEVLDDIPMGEDILRGDVTGDGVLLLGDPITLTMHLFFGAESPGCRSACDVDDDGDLTLDDVLGLLTYLYGAGPPPAAPFPACAPDPTLDSLGCAVAPACP
jgi:hypothetical protein